MRVGLLTTQAFSAYTMKQLHERHGKELFIVTISPAAAERAQVSGYRDFAPVCAELGVPCHVLERYDFGAPCDREALLGYEPDVLLVLGWNRLLPIEVLAIPRLGAIGSHSSPGPLPFGRGRSPVVWAVALGLRKVSAQLLRLDAGADTGDVLALREVPIGPEDTTQIMYYKLALAQADMIPQALEALAAVKPLPSSRAPELELPRRSEADATLDWTRGAQSLHDLVRAVSRPFHGAFFGYHGRRCILWRSMAWDGPQPLGRPGEVAAVFDAQAALVCTGQGALLMLDHDAEGLQAGDMLTAPPS